jgi:hypothetical protein
VAATEAHNGAFGLSAEEGGFDGQPEAQFESTIALSSPARQTPQVIVVLMPAYLFQWKNYPPLANLANHFLLNNLIQEV